MFPHRLPGNRQVQSRQFAPLRHRGCPRVKCVGALVFAISPFGNEVRQAPQLTDDAARRDALAAIGEGHIKGAIVHPEAKMAMNSTLPPQIGQAQ